MITFTVHDEVGLVAAVRFLDGWLPVVAERLSQLLGSNAEEVNVHVVLSTAAVHARRFPVDTAALRQLMDQSLIDELATHSGYLTLEVPPATYAHGVATRATEALHLPPEVAAGDAVICVDVETIRDLARELEVPFEALLGRTALHELSHVLRGHVWEDHGVTHGYVREGDAQRDAWQVLADLLADPNFAPTARAGRAAQVRLAAKQPSAYRHFGHASPDRYIWTRGLPEPPANWVIQPYRRLLPLTREPVIELPVRTGVKVGTPVIGDHAYLAGEGILVGPWVMIGRADVPHQPHHGETSATEELDKHLGAREQYAWLQLRPAPRQSATRHVPSVLRLSPRGELLADRIPNRLLSDLKASLEDAQPVLEDLADRLRQYQMALFQDAKERFGAEMAVKLFDPRRYEPFQES
ncbi:hypothetical protein ACFQU3_19845 [Terrabacter sp. GCM10028922]|uniref:hypothetical protein n=1 Tax=Terrabacter sp. GCM10028922 TaxID=3273428 RepID=UPI00361B658C